jgi:hypothetical protein
MANFSCSICKCAWERPEDECHSMGCLNAAVQASSEVEKVEDALNPEIVIIDPKRATFSDASKLQVERIVDLLRLGDTIHEAASKAGTDVETVMADTKARSYLAENLKQYSLKNQEIKGLVMSESVKLAIESTDEKVRLTALKLLAGVPGVDMVPSAKTNIQVGVGVQISEEVQSVLDTLED